MSAPVAPTFDLVDHAGRPVDQTAYRGRHLVVFFGFTHCRMVCPRALERLTAALELLGPLAERVQPLYVSVDPERDTPRVMRTFLATTAPAFTGLTGSSEQVAAVKDAFGVFSRRRATPDDPHGYDVPHTALTYVLDTDGRYVTHLSDALTAEQLADRLRPLLAARGAT